MDFGRLPILTPGFGHYRQCAGNDRPVPSKRPRFHDALLPNRPVPGLALNEVGVGVTATRRAHGLRRSVASEHSSESARPRSFRCLLRRHRCDGRHKQFPPRSSIVAGVAEDARIAAKDLCGEKHMIRLGNVFTDYLPASEKFEATEGEAWFWIAITASCAPWLALLAWLIWR
jgi:hypothetical protein